MATHIFVDNANIFGGAQRAAKTFEPSVPWYAIRVYYQNFFKVLEHGQKDIKTRVLGGSVPPGNDDLWDYAKRAHYNTDLLKRVNSDDGRLVEQGVDEVLQLKIALALLDHKAPQTLVLGSGDGRKTEFGSSFRDLIARAFKLGWNVRVFAWKDQLSGKLRRLDCDTVDMEVHELDRWYRSVTFVKDGRVVSKLTLP